MYAHATLTQDTHHRSVLLFRLSLSTPSPDITLSRVVHLPDATSISTKGYLIAAAARIESLASIGPVLQPVTGGDILYIYDDDG